MLIRSQSYKAVRFRHTPGQRREGQTDRQKDRRYNTYDETGFYWDLSGTGVVGYKTEIGIGLKSGAVCSRPCHSFLEGRPHPNVRKELSLSRAAFSFNTPENPDCIC